MVNNELLRAYPIIEATVIIVIVHCYCGTSSYVYYLWDSRSGKTTMSVSS